MPRVRAAGEGNPSDGGGAAEQAGAGPARPAVGGGVRPGAAAHVRSRRQSLTRTAVAAVGVACVAVAAVTTGSSAGTWEQPTEVLAAGRGALSTDAVALQGWRNDGSASGAGSAGSVGSVGAVDSGGSEVRGDAFGTGPDAWGDLGAWPGAAPGEDPFGAPFEIPAFEEPLAAAYPAGLGHGDIPAPSVRAYRAAAAVLGREQPGCGIDWALLAGIGRVESNHGRFAGAVVTTAGVSVPSIYGPRLDGSLAGTMVIRDTDGSALDGDPVYDRAVGPMQFIPGTWARWGSDGDRDGASNPQDIDDAALAAARYLCAGGADVRGAGAPSAVRRYNNSTEYVNLVLATASGYRDGDVVTVPGGSGPVSGAFDPPGWTPPVLYPGGPVGDRGSGGPGGSAGYVGSVGSVGRGDAGTVSPRPAPTPQPSAGPSSPAPPTTPTTPTTSQPTVRPTSPGTGRPTRPTTPPSGSPTGTPTEEPTGEPSGEPSGESTAPVTSAPPSTPASGAPTGSQSSAPATPPATTTTTVPTTSEPAGGAASEPASEPAEAPAEACDPDLVLDASGQAVDAATGEAVEGAVPCDPGPAPTATAQAEPARED